MHHHHGLALYVARGPARPGPLQAVEDVFDSGVEAAKGGVEAAKSFGEAVAEEVSDAVDVVQVCCCACVGGGRCACRCVWWVREGLGPPPLGVGWG